jgi:polyvinyl alcohol dehydrogenase (cytochrome)
MAESAVSSTTDQRTARNDRAGWVAAVMAILWSAAAAPQPVRIPTEPEQGKTGAALPRGDALYAARCAACHDHPVDRIPPKVFISTVRAPEDVVDALTSGVMKMQAAALTNAEIRAIAVYLTGREPAAARAAPDANRCDKPAQPLQLNFDDWNGWGRDPHNTRFQPNPGIAPQNVPRLKLRWAFAYPGRVAFGQPVIVGDLVLVGGTGGYVFALDAQTGCTRWTYAAGAIVRTAVTVGPISDGKDEDAVKRSPAHQAAWFGDDKGVLHAVDATTGKLLWKERLDDHVMARLLGAPKLHEGVLYAPVSSLEEVAAADPKYPCCTFRGSIVALDPVTGRKLWQSHSVRDTPKPFKIISAGTQMLGPAGGSIFSSPTIDTQRGLLYFGTGDAYTDVSSDSTNAVIAVSLKIGKRIWTRQVLRNDAWIMLCDGRAKGNCPSRPGFDFDFASSPNLATLADGRQLLVAGAKSGIVYAFDPEANGNTVWERSLVKGSSHGGILWGAAVDDSQMYVATSEYDLQQGSGPGALVALDLATGTVRWRTPTPQAPCAWGAARCSHALIAAVSAMPGIVFAGAMDGWIRAYDVRDGRIVWEFDTAQTFDAVNGAKATGGAIDYGGQAIAHGMLLVNSGSMRQPGNALLALSVDGQ